MKKDNQLMALFIFIPMLIFTLLITLATQKSIPYYNEVEDVIYKYFDYKNNKDIASLSTLLVNQNKINAIQSEIDLIEKVSIIDISEENSKSILEAYLRNDNNSKKENIKIFKVSYEVQYNSKDLNYKNGIYESWYFLTRENEQSKWLIDIF